MGVNFVMVDVWVKHQMDLVHFLPLKTYQAPATSTV